MLGVMLMEIRAELRVRVARPTPAHKAKAKSRPQETMNRTASTADRRWQKESGAASA